MDRFLYNRDLCHGRAKCRFRLMECLSELFYAKSLAAKMWVLYYCDYEAGNYIFKVNDTSRLML